MISDVVLAYIAHALDNSSASYIRCVCSGHFSHEEITLKRDTLWDKLKDDKMMPKMIKRQNITTKKGMENTISDILEAITILANGGNMPEFVVHFESIGRLPLSKPEESCPISICDRLAKLEARMQQAEEVMAMDHCRVVTLEENTRRMQGPIYSDVTRPKEKPMQPAKGQKERPQARPPVPAPNVHPVDGGTDTFPKQLLVPSAGGMKPASSMLSVASSKPSLNAEGFEYPAKHQRKRRQRFVRGQRRLADGKLVAAPEPVRDIFIYRLVKTTEEEDLIKYMTDNKMPPLDVKKVSHKDSKFASFRVQVKASLVEDVLHPDSWPENVCVRRFWQKTSEDLPAHLHHD